MNTISLLCPDALPEVSIAWTVSVVGPVSRQYTSSSPYPIARCSGTPFT